MKKLYLIRHAKSDWSDDTLNDFDRPLNKRGYKNAPFMAKLINSKLIKPDIILSSRAKRAKQTATFFQKEFGLEKVSFKDKLYESSLSTLLNILKQIKDKHNTVFLVGHNPSLNSLAYNLCAFEENIVTCGILEIEFDINSWSDISYETGKLISFEYPKKYKNNN